MLIKYGSWTSGLLHIYKFHSDWKTFGYNIMKCSSFKVMLIIC